MTKTILTCFHKYTPFGGEFYEPILDHYIKTMGKYASEYDKLYLLDSNWNINPEKIIGLKAEIVKVNPSIRYYDAYKEVLPSVKEDIVLFLDDDIYIYREGSIGFSFKKIESGEYDVVSIIDQIGTYETNKLKNGNKFCPYWFSAKKDLLMNYVNVDWSPDMPYCETLGHLTEEMLKRDINVFELEEDKSEVKLWNPLITGKNLGYYHIRNGSLAPYLLATKNFGNIDTYWEYLRNQPKTETIRLCNWYRLMGGNPDEIEKDFELL